MAVSEDDSSYLILIPLISGKCCSLSQGGCSSPSLSRAVTNALAKSSRDIPSVRDTTNFLNVAEPFFGSYDAHVAGAPSHLIAQLNARLTEASTEDGVSLLDIACASRRDGLDASFGVTRWLQAKMETAPEAAPHSGELLVRVIAAARGLSKNVLFST
jgi:hypothetical protein